jgi:hypothetical protein
MQKKLMNQTDYCYAAKVMTKDGDDYVCGFTRIFEGIKSIVETHVEVCDPKGHHGLRYSGVERCSRNMVIEFFTEKKKHKVKGIFLMHGFITGELDDKMFVKTPKDVNSFLLLKELYEEDVREDSNGTA